MIGRRCALTSVLATGVAATVNSEALASPEAALAKPDSGSDTEGKHLTAARHVKAMSVDHAEVSNVTAQFGLAPGDARQLTFGRYVIEPKHILRPHVHTSDSIAYCIRGSCAFEIGEDGSERFEMTPGDFVYVPAGMVHAEITGPDGVELIVARDMQGGETELFSPATQLD